MTRRIALIIATYDYDDAGLRGLTAPAHDAEALAEVLRDPLIGGFEVTALINEPHYRVGDAVGDFYSGARRDDLTLLYFSGHGLKDEGGKLYLATTNTRPLSPLFTSLPADQLDYAMTNSPSRRQVLILDCCYSGAFPSGAIAKSGDDVHAVERLGGRGRSVLTASDATQYAFEGGVIRGTAPQSVFTRHLVAGLRDGSADLDHDGDITIDELYSYVHDKVVQERPQQRPKKQDNVEGRTVLAANVNWTIPGYVRNALSSPLPRERLTALEHFDHLYRIGNPAVRARLREQAQHLLDDDSRSVSAAAHEWLESRWATAELAGGADAEPVGGVTEPPVVTEPAAATDSEASEPSVVQHISDPLGESRPSPAMAPTPVTSSGHRDDPADRGRPAEDAPIDHAPDETASAGVIFAAIKTWLGPRSHKVVAVVSILLLMAAVTTFVLIRNEKGAGDAGGSSPAAAGSASKATMTTLPFPPLASPNAVAVDDAGTVYVADNSVLKLPVGTSAAIALPFPPFEGTDRPRVLALDATGALYVADSARVFMLGSGAPSAETLPITGLSDIQGLAVDGNRNVYVLARNSATSENIQQVWLWARGAAGVVRADGATDTRDWVGLTIDSNGRLYTSSAATADLPATLIAYSVSGAAGFPGLRNPKAVTVDQSGALYIGGEDVVYQRPPWFDSSNAITRLRLTGLHDVKGLAANKYGGVYIADNGGPNSTGRVIQYLG
ncbi:caspase family protein [Nocardia sp. NPDC051321]|uniref:caspase, EACC1-associated type n=1 Tax=Nocardia sp. NPDC051321 TaxID=3364323 RepID=UPI003796309B